jgi:SAM-dependent methyltransferase
MSNYVHGYSERESKRLQDQANTLDELLHHDTVFPVHSKILEAGCGVGSQTKIIAFNNPSCQFTSIDVSELSLEKAKQTTQSLGIKNVNFQSGDIFNLDFKAEAFDHVFVCFVLEHLSNPVQALLNLKKVLKKGGTITVIEGDHESAYFYPRSDMAQKAIRCLTTLQTMKGGNAHIGRELYPLLTKAGFKDCVVSPRMVYVDSSKPFLVEGFTKNTFTAMIEGVEKEVLEKNLMTKQEWVQGIKDLYRTAEDGGVFCYTFFKGIAKNE